MAKVYASLIRKGLKEYVPSTTKIIIAQRIASVQDSDKIVILDCGKISALGTHQQLLENNEIYQELYYSQNKIEADKKEELEKGGEREWQEQADLRAVL